MKESEEYFNSRPFGSQIGAVVSPQSKPIPNRQILIGKEKELTEMVQEGTNKIEKPKHWFVE